MNLRRANTTGASRSGEIEWEWRKGRGDAGSMPSAEDVGDDVVQVYEEVRAAIALGERMFPRGAASTDKSMQSYHSGWKETHGVYQTNKALRSGQETEYEAFFGRDVADGLQEAWRRPMHWAGFLAMGASTCLPRGDSKEGGAGAAEDSKAATKDELMQELKDLKAMHDQEVIDADEFKELKTVLLQKLKGCY